MERATGCCKIIGAPTQAMPSATKEIEAFKYLISALAGVNVTDWFSCDQQGSAASQYSESTGDSGRRRQHYGAYQSGAWKRLG